MTINLLKFRRTNRPTSYFGYAGITFITYLILMMGCMDTGKETSKSNEPPTSWSIDTSIKAYGDEHNHGYDERDYGEDVKHDKAGHHDNGDIDHESHDHAGHAHGEDEHGDHCAQTTSTENDHDHEDDHHHSSEGKFVDIPSAVRQNLGITFITVERRPVRSTVRLAGEFELRPEARREYNAMIPGRVRLAVNQFDTVEAGDLLFELESPQWHRVQSDLAEAFKTCYCCLPELDAAKAAQTENETQIAFLKQRINRLVEAGSRDVELEAELSRLETKAPRLDAEVRAKEADMQSALLAYHVLLSEAQSLSGIPTERLRHLLDNEGNETFTAPLGAKKVFEHFLENQEDEKLSIPFWSTVNKITVRAEEAGVVGQVNVTNLGWAETGDLIVETIDPGMLRFHADALQTDINLFKNGQAGRIVPPQGGSIDLQDTIAGRIGLGFKAHPDLRTVPVYLIPDQLPNWAKAGVTAYLEVFLGGEEHAVTAIPRTTIVRDGLEKVIFKRDPRDPNKVIRTTPMLGASDGRWVEVLQGARPGDQVVLGGVYPLMLATSESGEIQQGGHFHADGTFHEKDDH